MENSNHKNLRKRLIQDYGNEIVELAASHKYQLKVEEMYFVLSKLVAILYEVANPQERINYEGTGTC